VFGRGGEEALALGEAGIDFEVVPGITSAVAVPAYAGVPVTHRGLSTSFTVVTGHSRFAVDEDTNWDALAAAGGTIVILMGVAHRAEIAKRLMDGGLARDTPVVAVTWGTRPQQRTVRTTLTDLADVTLEPPATIVVGAVAGLHLSWFEHRPLFGRRIVVTRARDQASVLSERLRFLGAEPIEVPAIRFGDPQDGGAGLRRSAQQLSEGGYRWVVFTSARAVERFVPLLRDARSFGSTQIAAIGPGTADSLARYHLVADLVPGEHIGEALVEAMPAGEGRVLLPRAAVARPTVPDGLRSKGWTVEVVEAYRTHPARLTPEALATVVGSDAITFTSSSTVTGFLAVAGLEAVPPVVACIGPVTAATAATAGLSVDVVASEHTISGLLDVLVSALATTPSMRG
jgi:uroporphyrinogen III methyltransferase/synthase